MIQGQPPNTQEAPQIRPDAAAEQPQATVNETDDRPSPIRQAVTRGLAEIGFAGLEVAGTLGAMAAGPIGVLPVAVMSDATINSLKRVWFAHEYEGVRQNELKEYNDALNQLMEEYTYKTTMVPDKEGVLGIPTGPPGPDGEPTNIINVNDPNFIAVRQRADTDMTMSITELTVNLYDDLQMFKNNPLIRDAMQRILTVQATAIEAITTPTGQQIYEEQQARGMGIEAHESEMETAEAKRGLFGAQELAAEAEARYYDRRGTEEEEKTFELPVNNPALWPKIIEGAMGNQLDRVMNSDSVRRDAAMMVFAGLEESTRSNMLSGLSGTPSEIESEIAAQIMDDATYSDQMKELQAAIGMRMLMDSAPKDVPRFEPTDEWYQANGLGMYTFNVEVPETEEPPDTRTERERRLDAREEHYESLSKRANELQGLLKHADLSDHERDQVEEDFKKIRDDMWSRSRSGEGRVAPYERFIAKAEKLLRGDVVTIRNNKDRIIEEGRKLADKIRDEEAAKEEGGATIAPR